MNFKNGDEKNTLLEFQIQDTIQKGASEYEKAISKFTKKMKLLNIKSLENDNLIISYYIKLKNKNQSLNLIKELQNISGIKNISLFSDEETF